MSQRVQQIFVVYLTLSAVYATPKCFQRKIQSPEIYVVKIIFLFNIFHIQSDSFIQKFLVSQYLSS